MWKVDRIYFKYYQKKIEERILNSSKLENNAIITYDENMNCILF